MIRSLFLLTGILFAFAGAENKFPQLLTAFLRHTSPTDVKQLTDPCVQARAGAVKATLLARQKVFIAALQNIQAAFAADSLEHAVSFSMGENGDIISSDMSNGNAMNGTVPKLRAAFADLHNHPKNIPPDAGDLYGLIDLNKNNSSYDTRFAVTQNGTLYALLISDAEAAASFNLLYPREAPAFKGSSPTFPSALVDEFREMKYRYSCNDEMTLAYILEKYNTGISLLKQISTGSFKKIRTITSGKGESIVFIAADCEW